MAPEDEQNNVPELCASTPWFKFRARGYDVLVTLVAILCGVTAYMVYTNGQSSVAAIAVLNSDTQHQHLEIERRLDAEVQAQHEMTYIMTLSQDQREHLNLSMPNSLRERLSGAPPQ